MVEVGRVRQGRRLVERVRAREEDSEGVPSGTSWRTHGFTGDDVRIRRQPRVQKTAATRRRGAVE